MNYLEGKKILYFDVETTGTNAYKNDIVQLGVIIEVNGEIVDQADIKCQPFNWDNIDPQALEITGNTIEKLKTFQPPKDAYQEFVSLLSKHSNKFDKNDKYYPAGYNVTFDLDFLVQFFHKNNDPYLGSFINWRRIDPLPILYFMELKGKLNLPNFKLETVCNSLGIEINAHDAFSDIKATREIIHYLMRDKQNR